MTKHVFAGRFLESVPFTLLDSTWLAACNKVSGESLS